MPDESPSFERLALLASVAHSYYIERVGQDELAERYGFSRSNISRLISEARRHGLVEIKVRQPVPTSADHAESLRERFPAVDAVVVEAQGSPADRLQQVGLAAWRQAERHLGPDAILGVSWGRALAAVVEHAHGMDAPGARIVQIGGVQDATVSERTYRVADHLGRRLGVDVVHFPSPLLADDARAARVLRTQSTVQAVVDLACQASAAIIGIGAVREKTDGTRHSRFDAQAARELEQVGALGDVCGYHFDATGRLVNCLQNRRVVGLGADRFRSLPNKIAVAVGDPKAAAISAALRGQWVDLLITDTATADAVLRASAPGDPSRD